jgi:putative SOS response-associated peptidase YedK
MRSERGCSDGPFFAFERARVTVSAMCGRFTQNLSWAGIHRLADLIGQPRNLAPRFNIAPTTPIEVIRATAAGNEMVPMYWGLVPSWWKKPLAELPSTFNARAETVAERPMFRGAFKYRRCVVPASGFYEWTGAKGAKTPHYFTSRDGRPLALAGIWDHWSGLDGGDDLPNATIIVGEANNWMRRFHDRMPIILDWRDAGAWMTGESPGALLRSPPDDALREWIVSKRLNKAGTGDDDPALIEPIEHA